jgi:hypothetical protein
MIAIFALVVILMVVLFTVPAIATSIARNVVANLDRAASGSIDQSVVEARLTRIEEAIDAMALQIERLSDHQRALLGPSPDASAADEPSRLRTP